MPLHPCSQCGGARFVRFAFYLDGEVVDVSPEWTCPACRGKGQLLVPLICCECGDEQPNAVFVQLSDGRMLHLVHDAAHRGAGFRVEVA